MELTTLKSVRTVPRSLLITQLSKENIAIIHNAVLCLSLFKGGSEVNVFYLLFALNMNVREMEQDGATETVSG